MMRKQKSAKKSPPGLGALPERDAMKGSAQLAATIYNTGRKG
jgi:hypothetical protein